MSKYVDSNKQLQNVNPNEEESKFFDSLVNVVKVFNSKPIMRAITLAGVVFTLGACSKDINQPTPVPTPTPIKTPGEMPSATPTIPNIEIELTEIEKYYYIWDAKKYDLYATLVAAVGYKNGDLDGLIKDGKISSKDIDSLMGQYETFVEYGTLYNDILNPIYDEEGYHIPFEQLVRIFKEENIKLTKEEVEALYHNLESILSDGTTIVSALPEEQRNKANELLDLFNRTKNTDISQFDAEMQSDDLYWKVRWYVDTHICRFGEMMSEFEAQHVIYNGQRMNFGEYARISGLYVKMIVEVENELNANYLKEGEDYANVIPEINRDAIKGYSK
ncbi:MAG: hypothetical protein WDA21_01380 [Bacilli bacterium]